jgi:hypothetical protein
MFSPFSLSPMRHVVNLAAAVTLAAGAANAQIAHSSDALSSSSLTISDSSSSANTLIADDSSSSLDALPAEPAANGASQEERGGGYRSRGHFSHLAFEAGAGFNAPVGNDTPYITWGGNFTGGVGFHFSPVFSTLLEFQFIDDKLPGAFIAAGNGGQGGNGAGGNSHILSITVAPVVDLFPKSANSVYLTGGGGYYHKSTNFTQELCCDFYGYPVVVTTDSFASNQLGGNLGIGYSHRVGGVYGDGTMKIFAEARYLFINTPPIGANNGLGTTELIPVTIGVRW